MVLLTVSVTADLIYQHQLNQRLGLAHLSPRQLLNFYITLVSCPPSPRPVNDPIRNVIQPEYVIVLHFSLLRSTLPYWFQGCSETITGVFTSTGISSYWSANSAFWRHHQGKTNKQSQGYGNNTWWSTGMWSGNKPGAGTFTICRSTRYKVNYS